MTAGESPLAFERPAWHLHAACRGLDPVLFFPELGESIAAAKEVCAGCPVRVECLDAALAQPERFGVWGGLSEKQRRKLRSPRAEAQHGTRRRYQSDGCRCDQCRAANSAYESQRRAS